MKINKEVVKKTIAHFFYFVKGSQHHFLRGNEKAGARNAFRREDLSNQSTPGKEIGSPLRGWQRSPLGSSHPFFSLALTAF